MDDPHGIAEIFRLRLEANLELLHPDAAAREAVQTVLDYLEASKFVDLSHKSSTEKTYVRVDRPPAEMSSKKEA